MITLTNLLWFAVCTLIAGAIVKYSRLSNITMLILIPIVWVLLAVGLFVAKLALYILLIMMIVGTFASVFTKK